MSGTDKTPECALDMHSLCAGPRVIRRQGAPSWEEPVVVIRCGCTCHRGGGTRAAR